MRRLPLFIFFCLIYTRASLATNTLSVNNVNGSLLEICCDFDSVYVAYQFDLAFDNDLMVEFADVEPISPGIYDPHYIYFSNPDSNYYRFVCLSMGNRPIQRNGTLLKLKLKCAESLPSGTIIRGCLTGIKFTTHDIREDELADIVFEAIVTDIDSKGDVNADGKVDVADIATIITVMAAGKWADPVLARNADLNGDGIVDVADIASVIS